MLQGLFSLLFPSRCAGCGLYGAALCSSCAARLPCAEPVEIPHAVALYAYGHPIVERAIRDLKYRRKREAANALIAAAIPRLHEFLYEQLQTASPQPIYVVPIPQHRIRSRERGYNQSVLIAQAIAAPDPNMRVVQVLIKTRSTISQVRIKHRSDRLHNLTHSMRASRSIDPNALYMIVDDVSTTGATFIEAVRALREAGAKYIVCIALAHGYAKKNKGY